MGEVQTFQSLFQLAVAANIGFAAVLTFQGDTISKEKTKMDSLLDSAKIFRNAAIERDKFGQTEQETFSNVVRLREEVANKIEAFENAISNWLRGISLLLAVISFGFLVYASLFPKNTAGGWVVIVSLAGNLPLLGYMGHVFVQSVNSVAPLRRRRRELDTTISQGLLNLI